MTTTGWIVLVILLVFVLSSYLWLWSVVRRKDRGENGMWGEISKSIRQPWHKEDQMLAELSQRVRELGKDQTGADKE